MQKLNILISGPNLTGSTPKLPVSSVKIQTSVPERGGDARLLHLPPVTGLYIFSLQGCAPVGNGIAKPQTFLSAICWICPALLGLFIDLKAFFLCVYSLQTSASSQAETGLGEKGIFVPLRLSLCFMIKCGTF